MQIHELLSKFFHLVQTPKKARFFVICARRKIRIRRKVLDMHSPVFFPFSCFFSHLWKSITLRSWSLVFQNSCSCELKILIIHTRLQLGTSFHSFLIPLSFPSFLSAKFRDFFSPTAHPVLRRNWGEKKDDNFKSDMIKRFLM